MSPLPLSLTLRINHPLSPDVTPSALSCPTMTPHHASRIQGDVLVAQCQAVDAVLVCIGSPPSNVTAFLQLLPTEQPTMEVFKTVPETLRAEFVKSFGEDIPTNVPSLMRMAADARCGGVCGRRAGWRWAVTRRSVPHIFKMCALLVPRLPLTYMCVLVIFLSHTLSDPDIPLPSFPTHLVPSLTPFALSHDVCLCYHIPPAPKLCFGPHQLHLPFPSRPSHQSRRHHGIFTVFSFFFLLRASPSIDLDPYTDSSKPACCQTSRRDPTKRQF